MAQSPGHVALLWWRKFRLFFSNQEVALEDDVSAIMERSATLFFLPMRFGLLLVLAALGACSVYEKRRERLWLLGGLVLAALVPNLLTHVNWRFRLHTVLPLSLLAAYGLRALAEKVRAPRGFGFRDRGLSENARLWRPSLVLEGLRQ